MSSATADMKRIAASKCIAAFVAATPLCALLYALLAVMMHLLYGADAAAAITLCGFWMLGIYSLGGNYVRRCHATRIDAALRALARVVGAAAAVLHAPLLPILRIASAPATPQAQITRRLLHAALLPRIFAVSLRTSRA